jgi:predicted ATPase
VDAKGKSHTLPRNKKPPSAPNHYPLSAMPTVESIELKRSDGINQTIPLTHPHPSALEKSYLATFITGQNGSYKSSTLTAIAERLISPGFEVRDSGTAARNRPHVLCVSGSAADRFPHKQSPGGRRTAYDVPNYAYIGQRVMSNLLSKKAPIEQMLIFSLDPRKSDRFKWNFFGQAHDFAGVNRSTEIAVRKTRHKGETIDALRRTQDASRGILPKSPSRPLMSEAMADWLLDEFTYDEFRELDQVILRNGPKRDTIQLTEFGCNSHSIQPNVLRLGFLMDLFIVEDISIQHKKSGSKLSAFELSSGEFQMYTTLMAIGFGLEEESTLLIDEPENSLHPQWQRALMNSVFEICDSAMRDGQVVISTHSPMIIGSAPEGSAIVDLSQDSPVIDSASYGASADELLLGQFGVGSSRNRSVVNAVQHAVNLFERNEEGGTEYLSLIPELRLIQDSLNQDDPLMDVIQALISEAEQ